MSNWYRFSKDFSEIREVAEQVRQEAEGKYGGPDLRALCHEISSELAKRLISKGFVSAIEVRGSVYIDFPDDEYYDDWDESMFESEEKMEEEKHYATHHWVEVGNIIVDSTADQFNDELDGDSFPPVFISTKEDAKRHKSAIDWD